MLVITEIPTSGDFKSDDFIIRIRSQMSFGKYIVKNLDFCGELNQFTFIQEIWSPIWKKDFLGVQLESRHIRNQLHHCFNKDNHYINSNKSNY